MPREWTEEQKQAARERLAKAREAKAAKKPEVSDEVTISKSEFQDLLKTVSELKSQLNQPNQFRPLEQARVTSQGLIGVQEKYSTTRSYPDPTDRLRKESRLAPFAFDYNYDLTFEVSTSQYKTAEGVTVKEPKFHIKLLGVRLDDAGNRTNQRYIIRQLMFHEDPEAALVLAKEQGIQVDENDEAAFLDEMRYLRAKAWLLDVFYPPKPQAADRRREEVIGNQVVEVFEITSDKEENAKGLL